MKKRSPTTIPLPGASAICNLGSLQPRGADDNTWNVIIETPKDSRNKYVYDHQCGLFRLKKVMPLGNVFPFDFGFLPSTLADDGDPIDVLVFMDTPAFPGCLVPSRLVGVIEGQQTEEGKKLRNDRLIAVATDSHNHRDIATLKDLDESIVTEIEHFFVAYHDLAGTPFKPIGRRGPKHARRLVETAMQAFFDRLRAAALEKAG